MDDDTISSVVRTVTVLYRSIENGIVLYLLMWWRGAASIVDCPLVSSHSRILAYNLSEPARRELVWPIITNKEAIMVNQVSILSNPLLFHATTWTRESLLQQYHTHTQSDEAAQHRTALSN